MQGSKAVGWPACMAVEFWQHAGQQGSGLASMKGSGNLATCKAVGWPACKAVGWPAYKAMFGNMQACGLGWPARKAMEANPKFFMIPGMPVIIVRNCVCCM